MLTRRNTPALPLVALLLVFVVGCNRLAFRAADQARRLGSTYEPCPSIEVPPGLQAMLVVKGLNYPSAMTWDDEGRMYVLESYTVPVPTLELRILAVYDDGLEEVPLGGDEAPTGKIAVGLTFHDGWLYFSHEEQDGTFGISRVPPTGGEVEAVLRGLPAAGDHDVNHLVFDDDGNLYFGVGSATNSGVVSSYDPVNGKWLKLYPEVRDFPCQSLVLTAQSFVEPNGLSEDESDMATTGAFEPYGRSGATRIPARTPCSTAVYKLAPGSRTPERLAWGFRNPVALAFDGDGQLLIGSQGADVRSTRPILDDPDAIYRLREGAWYGWPDYSAALVAITDDRYRAPARYFGAPQNRLTNLIDLAASGLEPPDPSLLVAALEPHAALGGMDTVPDDDGPLAPWAGQLLVSEMGDFRPTTDPVHADRRAGFQVEAIDLASGRRTVFARNHGTGVSQPASSLDLKDGLERPVNVKIGPDGMVYILDFGVFVPEQKSAKVFPKTGKVFRIEPVE